MTNPVIPMEAIDAAVPWINNFFERRGTVLLGQEAQALASYALGAAAPYLMAQAWQEGVEAEADRAKWDSVGPNPYRQDDQ